MQQTWKPTVAGILDIIAGILGLFAFILLVFGLLVFMPMGGTNLPVQIPAQSLTAIMIAVSVTVVILAVLAIVGGTYALRRRVWGVSLAGSIASFFCSWPLGIVAIILTAISKREFE